MRWSKLKQVTEARFAPEVRGRVGLHMTAYRYELSRINREERAWITIDGREIVNMHRHMTNGSVWVYDNDRNEHDVYETWDLYGSMRALLTCTVDDALAGKFPGYQLGAIGGGQVLRGLAILDARVGRRRLARLDPDQERPLVAELLRFRLAARPQPAANGG